jgi:hypothetical protein
MKIPAQRCSSKEIRWYEDIASVDEELTHRWPGSLSAVLGKPEPTLCLQLEYSNGCADDRHGSGKSLANPEIVVQHGSEGYKALWYL